MKPTSDSPGALQRYPLYVVSGAWGSGKTSLINALLELRPAHERWAILLNEEGRTQVNGGSTESGVTVRDAAGACACCTGQVVFVTTLAALIRQTKPHRVFIEASSQASLDSLLKSIYTAFKDSVEVERVIQLASRSSPVATVEQDSPTIVTLLDWPDVPTLDSLLEFRSRNPSSTTAHALP
jgi:G3E family GTPase